MSNLDDFFAKKDNKKTKKKKSNYLATDELYKTLEESAKQTTEAGNDAEKVPGNESQLEGGPLGSIKLPLKPIEFGICFSEETVDDEDEWRDFTEENRMQYTSARRGIQLSQSSTILSSIAGGEVKTQDLDQRDTGGDGIDVGGDDGMPNNNCPWQKLEGQIQQTQKNLRPDEQSAKQEDLFEVKRQVYVPPALRQSQGDFNQRHQVENRPRNTPSKISGKPQAPDLNSPEFFPSLSGPKTTKRNK